MRVSPVPVLRGFGAAWVNIFRNTPLTLIIFFCYFGLFATLGLSSSDDINLNNFWLGVIGLSVYTAAFVCEAFRSGINTVPAGPGRGGPGDRPDVRADPADHRPAAGGPGGDRAAGQRLHRADEEHARSSARSALAEASQRR